MMIQKNSTIDQPSILPSDVEASIKRLKRIKAPGEDNITGGILQDTDTSISKHQSDFILDQLIQNW